MFTRQITDLAHIAYGTLLGFFSLSNQSFFLVGLAFALAYQLADFLQNPYSKEAWQEVWQDLKEITAGLCFGIVILVFRNIFILGLF
jgi:hypothetical protein